MKKVVLLFLLSLGIFNGIGYASTVLANCPDITPWIKFGVTFHRPKLDCKEGFGFCLDVTWGIDGGGYSAEKICPVQGYINEKNQLIIRVTETDLARYENGSTLPHFKGKASVTIEDPYTLSKDLSYKLGSQVPITIKPGTYPITYAEKAYVITIQL